MVSGWSLDTIRVPLQSVSSFMQQEVVSSACDGSIDTTSSQQPEEHQQQGWHSWTLDLKPEI